MPKKLYVVSYWYHHPDYVYEVSGDFYTSSLTDVFAFTDFVKRIGGTARCSI